MPVFFQHQINENCRLGIWKIEESESFFRDNVPAHRDVTHPHKRLQHFAGRFLLRFLYPDFPYELIQIADTNKPFLQDEAYHFSISHCGDFAAAIVSSDRRVGMDIEAPVEKILRIREKFLTPGDMEVAGIGRTRLYPDEEVLKTTLLWSVKEAVFKWYGEGAVDFREHIRILEVKEDYVACLFEKTGERLEVWYRRFDRIVLTWVI